MRLKLWSCSLLLAALVTAFTLAKSFTVKGRVIDEKGMPVSSASVTIKGRAAGTTTDARGAFSIAVPRLKTWLAVSSAGYRNAEVEVTDRHEIVVCLKPSTEKPEEVSVTSDTIHAIDLDRGVVGGVVTGYSSLRQLTIGANSKTLYNAQQAPSPNDLYNTDTEREGYDHITENRFMKAIDNPLSTFSIDVDAASYSNVRRMLRDGQLPPTGAVRIEEMINYFTYQYPQPSGDAPFSINTETASCPWNPAHRIVSIGLQGKVIPAEKLPASNLTFLIDVSGSMNEENKLPLVKASLKILTEQLREQDRVSIVVYAGNAGLVLPPTPGTQKATIMQALENLEAGGSTAGGEGIQLAYKTAGQYFIPSGNNRVILCTDGDFNVGQSSDDALERLIEEERKSGIFLTVLGYGTGNYQDAKMQKLADKGNGNHAYIDNRNEARKVLVKEFGSTLFTIAKDVKLQVEFNPDKVQGYRLIGYENRMLAKEDFNNDKKDAGELGSGHTVTALYEIIPAGIQSTELDSVDPLKYRQPLVSITSMMFSGELMNIKLRYKQPAGDTSRLLQHPVIDQQNCIETASGNLRFAAAVAQFGMLLRNSANKAGSSYALIEQLAQSTAVNDPEGYRKEFLELVRTARKLSKEVAVNK